MAVISVDAGTTMIKAVGYDSAGVESAVVRQATTLRRREPGWVEQDMAEVWDAVRHAVGAVAAELGEPVEYLALTAQGDGCWLVDREARPTGPAILWNDGRAAAVVERWRAEGVLEAAYRINGSLGFAGLPHAILTWLREHDPDRLDRSAAALTCGGWLFAQCTGRIGVDISDGSAPLLDITTAEYSAELLARFDLGWAHRLLPDLLDGPRRVAELTPAPAGQLGLPAGIPVVLSVYDIASTALGAGAVEPGQACGILGTTLCTEVIAEGPDLAGPAAGLTVRLGSAGPYLRALPTLAGGEVITWACGLLGLAEPGELGVLAQDVEVGAGGLSFLPYLSPAGERAPFLDERARGSLMGLSFEHTRNHVARAVLEGLTLVIRDCLGTLGTAVTELRVCGGGAASATWCQLIADISGAPTVRSRDREVGARGAMLVAEAHTGRAPDVPTAARRYVRSREVFDPDPTRHQRYEQLYQDFRALRDVAAAGWPRLAEMRRREPSLTATGPLPPLTPEQLAREEGFRVPAPQQTVTHPRRPS